MILLCNFFVINFKLSPFLIITQFFSSPSPYRCEIYNGSICSDVFTSPRWVYLNKPVAKIEKKLQKWFKSSEFLSRKPPHIYIFNGSLLILIGQLKSFIIMKKLNLEIILILSTFSIIMSSYLFVRLDKETGQITKECWPHAKALTCAYHYPECNRRKDGASLKTNLCSQHCQFMNRNVCKDELQRSRISSKFRQFLPLCEEVALFDDSDGRNCFFLPTVDFSKGKF